MDNLFDFMADVQREQIKSGLRQWKLHRNSGTLKESEGDLRRMDGQESGEPIPSEPLDTAKRGKYLDLIEKLKRLKDSPNPFNGDLPTYTTMSVKDVAKLLSEIEDIEQKVEAAMEFRKLGVEIASMKSQLKQLRATQESIVDILGEILMRLPDGN